MNYFLGKRTASYFSEVRCQSCISNSYISTAITVALEMQLQCNIASNKESVKNSY